MKRYLRIGLLLGLVMAAGGIGFALSTTPSFQQGNEAYRSHDFQKAYDHYLRASQDVKAPEIYYNMANAAFKMNQLGAAILNYERARELNPRDGDMLSNLKYARTLVEYRVEDKRGWYYRKLSEGLELIRLRECYGSLLIVYFFLIGILLFNVSVKKRFAIGRVGMWLLATLLILAALTWVKIYETKISRKAVVTGEKVDVRYGPSRSDQLAFSLVEGIELSVDDQSDEWYRISLVNGASGWAHRDGIDII